MPDNDRPIDYQYGYDKMTRQRMDAKMRDGWKSEETPCGRGSEYDMTSLVRRALPAIVESYDIETITDAGAGDLNWINHVDWFGPVSYYAYDLVPRHSDVEEWDITYKILPERDLIICRHVLNHLSVRLAFNALCAFRASGSRWLLITNCKNQWDYWDRYGLQLSPPIDSFKDATKWRLELHDMHKEFFTMRHDAHLR